MVLYLFQDVHGLLENVAPAALAAVAERANDETQSGEGQKISIPLQQHYNVTHGLKVYVSFLCLLQVNYIMYYGVQLFKYAQ